MDLFDLAPHPELQRIINRIDAAEPWTCIKKLMAEGEGFGRAGSSVSQVVFGFGVQGRGRSAHEAAQQWLRGAQSIESGEKHQ